MLNGLPEATPSDTRVVFMGTPDFAVPTLRHLLDRYPVVAVLTQPDRPSGRGRRVTASPVKALVEGTGIPILQPRSLRRERDVVAELERLEPDLIVVAAYGLILPGSVLELGRWGAVNVHASLLPRWRGAAPIRRAILAGDTETGITLMKMDQGLDTGPVLSRHPVAIGPEETGGELTARLAELGADALRSTLPRYLSGEIEPEPQADSLATYAERIVSSERALDWRLDALELALKVRAFEPDPGAYTWYEGTLLKVRRARALDSGPSTAPGRVVSIEDSVGVECGSGVLRLDQVQPAGKASMSAVDFARGRPGFVGSTLELVDPVAGVA